MRKNIIKTKERSLEEILQEDIRMHLARSYSDELSKRIKMGIKAKKEKQSTV